MCVAYPQEGGPISIGQVAMVGADAKKTMLEEGVGPVVRSDFDFASLVVCIPSFTGGKL